ncbi:MAG: GIY-YIG nuclease family protein [Candidatus Saccharibacteria bacterium]|nr:GIY-YIG nuclease family protein [Candidatus Saccharibacteria bacterium]
MYHVYVLMSKKTGRLYIGSTADVVNRLRLHNNGRVKSTKGYRPWKLLEHSSCDTRSEATRLERHLKSGQQRERLKKKYNHGAVAEW